MSAAEKPSAKPKKKREKKSAPEKQEALSFPYAVVRTGSKQYRVCNGDMILVEKLEVAPGNEWVNEDVLFVAVSPGKFHIGQPVVKGAKVNFEVLQHTLSKKIRIRHHRKRKSSQKSLGHRQPQTRLLVKSILAA